MKRTQESSEKDNETRRALLAEITQPKKTAHDNKPKDENTGKTSASLNEVKSKEKSLAAQATGMIGFIAKKIPHLCATANATPVSSVSTSFYSEDEEWLESTRKNSDSNEQVPDQRKPALKEEDTEDNITSVKPKVVLSMQEEGEAEETKVQDPEDFVPSQSATNLTQQLRPKTSQEAEHAYALRRKAISHDSDYESEDEDGYNKSNAVSDSEEDYDYKIEFEKRYQARKREVMKIATEQSRQEHPSLTGTFIDQKSQEYRDKARANLRAEIMQDIKKERNKCIEAEKLKAEKNLQEKARLEAERIAREKESEGNKEIRRKSMEQAANKLNLWFPSRIASTVSVPQQAQNEESVAVNQSADIEPARQAELARQQEAARQAELARQQEAARQAELARQQETARLVAEQETARLVAEQETARLVAEQEAARLAAEQALRQEAQRIEAARIEAARQAELAPQQEENVRVADQQQRLLEIARQEEADRVLALMLQNQFDNQDRIAADEILAEDERLAAALAENEEREAARLAEEEAARLAEEEARRQQEAAQLEVARLVRQEAQRLEAQRIEAERLAREDAQRIEAERLAREDAQRIEAARQQAEAQRIEAERLAREDAQRIEVARQQAEALRVQEEIRALQQNGLNAAYANVSDPAKQVHNNARNARFNIN